MDSRLGPLGDDFKRSHEGESKYGAWDGKMQRRSGDTPEFKRIRIDRLRVAAVSVYMFGSMDKIQHMLHHPTHPRTHPGCAFQIRLLQRHENAA